MRILSASHMFESQKITRTMQWKCEFSARGTQGHPGHTEAASQPRGAARKRQAAQNAPWQAIHSTKTVWFRHAHRKKRTGQLPQQLLRPSVSDFVHFGHLDLFFSRKKRFFNQKCDAIKQLKKWQVSQLLQTVSNENRFFKRTFETTTFSRDRVQKRRFWMVFGDFHSMFTVFFETTTKPPRECEKHVLRRKMLSPSR